MLQTSFQLKASTIKKEWLVIDAEGVVLGRLASEIAKILRGKNKPTFTPNQDGGDYVIVINADKVRLTGTKRADKVFYYHTGHPGGIKERKVGHILEGKHPERVVTKAVERMISRGPLARKQMTHLFVYKGNEHPHAAQNPAVYDFASKNPKNKRGAL